MVEIKKVYGTNMNERTAVRYVYERMQGVSFSTQGKKCTLSSSVVEALRSAIVSYIQLINPGMIRMSYCKYMIRKLTQCIKKSQYEFKRIDRFYD